MLEFVDRTDDGGYFFVSRKIVQNSGRIMISRLDRHFNVIWKKQTEINTAITSVNAAAVTKKGEYVMLHGPRAVGKSTRMLQACDDLEPQYHCLNVDITLADRGGNLDMFWKSFSDICMEKQSPQLSVSVDLPPGPYSVKSGTQTITRG